MSKKILLVVLLLSVAVACKKSEQNGGQATPAPTPTPEMVGPDGEPLVTFEPELLLPEARTRQYTVVLPRVQYQLSKDPQSTVILTIAVQAANETIYEALEAQQENLSFVITSALDKHTGMSLVDPAGKVALKEAIIQQLQQRIQGSRGIRTVYFLEFQVYRRS
ncbi:MAG: flagellar basal body-associated FliL family protein [Candidatus Sumerlaeota bacterium]